MEGMKSKKHDQGVTKLTKIYSLMLIVTVLTAFGCASSTAQQANDTNASKAPPKELSGELEEDKKAIKAALIDMWDAIEKGDMERYASYVHPDFTQFGETAKKLRVGKEAEVKAIKEWVEEPTTVSTQMKDPRVTVRGDTAWITYYWSDKGTSKGKPFATKGKSTRIYVREKGKWLCIHGHYTLLEED